MTRRDVQADSRELEPYVPPWTVGLGLTPVQSTYLVLAVIILAGAGLRFIGLGAQSFGHDEAVTVGRVLRPALGSTLHEVGHSERTPYLYYVLAWLWTRVLGTGAVGVRSLSALLGTLTIPVAFAAGRAAVSERTGLLAAALVAGNPFLVYYSQEARSYALLAFLAGCTLWATARAIRAPSNRAVALWALCCALGLFTHYFAAFLVGAEAVCLLAMVRPRRPVVYACVVPALAGVALLPLLTEQLGRQGGGVDQTAVWRQVPTAAVQFMFGERLSIRGLYALTPVLGAAATLAVIAVCLIEWRRGRRLLFAVGAAGVLALLAPFVLEVGGLRAFNARNCIGSLIAALILLAGYLTRRGLRVWGAAAASLLLAAGLALSVALGLVASLQRPDFRDAARALGDATEGSRALVVSPGGDTVITLYRAGHQPELVPGAGASVAEIDVIETDDQSPGGAAPSGFKETSRRDFGTVRLTRLVADGPRAVSRTSLRALVPAVSGPTLLLETRG